MTVANIPFDIQFPSEVNEKIVTSISKVMPPAEAVRELVRLSTVSWEWNEHCRKVIIATVNGQHLSLSSIGINCAEKAEVFFREFGEKITFLSLENLAVSTSMQDRLFSYCPNLWSMSKQIGDLEKYIKSLDPDLSAVMIERIQTGATERDLDILEDGIIA